jgi:hypothetical protein
VHVKVWIHFFIGDTKGNNKWLGQYPGNSREGVRHPYCDCQCQFYKVSTPNPNCIYLTIEEIKFAKKRKQEDEDAGIKYYSSISMYDIRNVLTEKSLPLSEVSHLKMYNKNVLIYPTMVFLACLTKVKIHNSPSDPADSQICHFIR